MLEDYILGLRLDKNSGRTADSQSSSALCFERSVKSLGSTAISPFTTKQIDQRNIGLSDSNVSAPRALDGSFRFPNLPLELFILAMTSRNRTTEEGSNPRMLIGGHKKETPRLHLGVRASCKNIGFKC